MKENAIGIFDSGVGGLTVLKELISILPNENYIYLGDTARVPYGTKSDKTILKFSIENSRFLLDKKVKMIVVACNTASAVGFSKLSTMFDVPIVNVIEPGAKAAAASTANSRVGIIGTATTISTNAYDRLIKIQNPEIETFSKACPLFVPLVEEMWFESDITRQVAKIYLELFKDTDIDTLVLGCTHYPLIKKIIGSVMGERVNLIDSAYETSRTVKKTLIEKKLINETTNSGCQHFYFSDLSANIKKILHYIINGVDDSMIFETEVF
jgi:glutamate racemase